MKKKILVKLLFVLFALPIPVAVLGSLLSLLWFISSIIKIASFVEIIMAIFGVIIGATYIISYMFSLDKTWSENKFSAKTLIPLGHCLIAFVFVLLLKPVGNYVSSSHEYFGFAKKDFTVVEEMDTHGGFLGDGSYYLILDCSDNKEEALEKISGWKKLPLSANLSLIMYGGERDGITYIYNLAEKAKIPKVENGYYMFEDRHSESNNSQDDSRLLYRRSCNFSIAIYDCDTDKMYYFEFDT